jgi:hypothetical protein
MNVLQLLAHSIEEHDQLHLLAGLGHEVASIGAYIDPAHPQDDKRPPLDIPGVPFVKDAVDRLGQAAHPGHGRCDGATAHADPLDAAKRDLPDDVVDWADVIVCHHLEREWLVGQWPRIRHKRVVWRTVGQSGDANEAAMAPLRADGLQIVRYSPRERHIPNFAGEDALIRFYKDPAEWDGWNGHVPVVTNVTQNMLDRDPWCNPRFWVDATRGLPVRPMGSGSETMGGTGGLPLERMKNGLRNARAYLYTGTQPASYTLGLLEAGMIGTPIVSIGSSWMKMLAYGPLLFEAPDLVPLGGFDDPAAAAAELRRLLLDIDYAREVSVQQRAMFVETFGIDTVAAAWQAFLTGQPSAAAPELVAVPA